MSSFFPLYAFQKTRVYCGGVGVPLLQFGEALHLRDNIILQKQDLDVPATCLKGLDFFELLERDKHNPTHYKREVCQAWNWTNPANDHSCPPREGAGAVGSRNVERWGDPFH